VVPVRDAFLRSKTDPLLSEIRLRADHQSPLCA